jgi:hypothetical protein
MIFYLAVSQKIYTFASSKQEQDIHATLERILLVLLVLYPTEVKRQAVRQFEIGKLKLKIEIKGPASLQKRDFFLS